MSNSAQTNGNVTSIAITGVVHDQPNRGDDYVKIFYIGPRPLDLSGFILRAVSANKEFVFPPGAQIQDGQTVRVYSNKVEPETGGFSFGSAAPIWNREGDLAQLVNAGGFVVSDHVVGKGPAGKIAGNWNSFWTGGAKSYANLVLGNDGTGEWSGPTSSGRLQGTISVNGTTFVGTYTFTNGPSGDCTFISHGDTLVGVWGDGKLWNATRRP